MTLALGIGGAALLAFDAIHLWRAELPLLNLRVLRIKTLRQAAFGISVMFWVIGAGPYLAPIKFELQFGWSPVKAGALLLFMWTGNIGVKPIANRIYRALGFRPVIFVTALLLAASSLALGLATARTPMALIALELFVWGTTMSTAASGISPMLFADVGEKEMRDATVLQSTVTQLSVGLGVAGSAVALRLGHSFDSGDPSAPYTSGWIAVTLFSLLVAVCAARLHPKAGEALRGRLAVETS